MEFLKLLAIILLLSTTIFKPITGDTNGNEEEYDKFEDFAVADDTDIEGNASSSHETSRYLAEKNKIPPNATCNAYPKVCRREGSPGRNCCAKKCVDFKTDRNNCGYCGNKCSYGTNSCCKGKCVDLRSDGDNCGFCGYKCSNGKDCCKGKCVNLRIDRYNCGNCGQKCKYGEDCCKRKCVNTQSNRKNCGRCNNKCESWEYCEYGMCSYA